MSKFVVTCVVNLADTAPDAPCRLLIPAIVPASKPPAPLGTAALLQGVGGQVRSGLVAIISGWPLYALLVVGPAGFLVNQLAFQAGPLVASLPAITAVDPLMSIVLGLLLFDEQLHGRPAAAVAECLALSVLALSVLRLARTKQTPADEGAGQHTAHG